jgi:hypothetical protein
MLIEEEDHKSILIIRGIIIFWPSSLVEDSACVEGVGEER